ncbi:MAG: MgtC/SapB family protein [Eubacterium sp.]|nr:MgtC/SapB family protein [Eubacterium sp.]
MYTNMVNYLHEFNFVTVLLRLVLALLAGGMIGYGRAKKKRAAGFRTYMLASVGAALAIMLSMYEYKMMQGAWAPIVAQVGEKFDASRYAAQVISGIGFLGAGTIIATAHSQVSGLSSAAGMLVCVAVGMTAGCGFYSCLIVGVICTVFVLDVMSPIETAYKRRIRNITLVVEFDKMEDIQTIVHLITDKHVKIFDIDVERTEFDGKDYPSAVFTLKLDRDNTSHSDMLSSLAELVCIRSVHELIA